MLETRYRNDAVEKAQAVCLAGDDSGSAVDRSCDAQRKAERKREGLGIFAVKNEIPSA